MRIVLAQINLLVGDIQGNRERILAAATRAVADHQAELVIFPELALSGYPPEDLLLTPDLYPRVESALARLQQEAPTALLLGCPLVQHGKRFNAAAFIDGEKPIQTYHKRELPNYREFDEVRYFSPGTDPTVVAFKGLRIGLSICEDIWCPTPVTETVAAGADVLVNISASPFRHGKLPQRLAVLRAAARTHHLPVIYCNLVGGQDELIFDGGSMALSATGELRARAPFFEECLRPLDVATAAGTVQIIGGIHPAPEELESTWLALVTALRDYAHKNHFQDAILGLSGGIDSALTLALAVDALGAGHVRAIMMPYHYTAQISLDDAQAEAKSLGVAFQILPIEAPMKAFEGLLAAPVDATPGSTQGTTLAHENLQARCRGALLMALSNQSGALVLATSNKSESAVGYATLYGDMVGGYAILKDVYKTRVYDLARLYNQRCGADIIPQRVITRPPSAELAPDQKDQDSLPDYPTLDAILARHLEQDMDAAAIIADGFAPEIVRNTIDRVQRNEYKRRQAPPGPSIGLRAFGKDRRYPITNGATRSR